MKNDRNWRQRWGILFVVLAAWRFTASADEARWGSFWEPQFPFLEATVDARKIPNLSLTNNLTVRGVVLPLGSNTFACFDTDLLRWSLVWHGDFLKFASTAPISYAAPGRKNDVGQADLNQPLGEPISAVDLHPGVAVKKAIFQDPRPVGLDPGELGRGPIPTSIGRWEGIYTIGNQAVLHYSVGNTPVHEFLVPISGAETAGYARNLEIGPHSAPLQFVVTDSSTVTRKFREASNQLIYAGGGINAWVIEVRIADGEGARLMLDPSGSVICQANASAEKQLLRMEVVKRISPNPPAQHSPLPAPAPSTRFEMPSCSRGGPARWPDTITTHGMLATNDSPYVVDRLELPDHNPWKRQVRPTSLCFYPDGRAAVVTFDGDVWQVSGIDQELKALTWKRIASGLNEPQSIHFYHGFLYVFTRNGIVRLRDLNGDGEIDYYENFANCFAQSAETRDFAMDSKIAPDGSFYISEAGQQETYLGLNSASVLKISPDGRKAQVIADGLRGAYLGYNPRLDLLTASDQQGNWVPTSPIIWIQKGSFYGFYPATKIQPPTRPVTEPICWIPYRAAQSTCGQTWALDANLGPLNDQLIQLDYFHPRLLVSFFDSPKRPVQGATFELDTPFDFPLLKGEINPKDGCLYLAGFRIWGSNAKDWAGLGRLRYTSRPFAQPVGARSGSNGLLVEFGQPLQPEFCTNLANFNLQRWNYLRSEAYGSGHYLLNGAPGQEAVPIYGALLPEDRKSIFLYVPNMTSVMQMDLGYRLQSQSGCQCDGHVYFTVHELQELNLKKFGFTEINWNRLQLASPTRRLNNSPQVISAEEGRHFYETLGCVACHSIDGSTNGRAGPSFKGLFGRVQTFARGEPEIADETYIKESILKPQAKIVKGYEKSEVTMPTYEGVVTDDQIQCLIRFIESLAPAKTAATR